MSGRTRVTRRFLLDDPLGTIAKWTYGLGSAATLALLAQIVGADHDHTLAPPRPPLTTTDLPADE
ncbi:hypothetical protein [Streptomyces mobaraensis]|uniref:Uncharacterized protein n=1 Tax=Streptomyces mobaraensis TaxID=35621 RepID=A0A5N5W1L3_STRMB|nr:hypothetical protein [Streptomyces mobaraensis]KAB7835778.1 hypothetical protein FRZ00_26555 [Streptomyces mobaraensis]